MAIYEDIFRAINVPNWDAPFTQTADPDLGLANPYSKVSCLILYLYSMELGVPPLYAEANRVAIDNDFSQLQNLGPFLQCLNFIPLLAE